MSTAGPCAAGPPPVVPHRPLRLQQASRGLPADFTVAGFRSRGMFRAFTVEVALDCAETTDVAAIRRVGRMLAGELARALPGVEINLAVNTVTIAVEP